MHSIWGLGLLALLLRMHSIWRWEQPQVQTISKLRTARGGEFARRVSTKWKNLDPGSSQDPRKKWQRLGRIWQNKTQMDKTQNRGSSGSWLQPCIVGNDFSVGCKVCAGAGLKTVWARFEVRKSSQLQLVSFNRHAETPSHKSAMSTALAEPSNVLSCRAPSKDDFETIIEEQQKGITFNASRLGRKKATQMTWCFAEAIRDLDKEFFRGISELALHSDGSGRILRAYFNACNKQMDTRRGVFGAVRDSGSTAHEIKDSIIDICKKFSSSRAHPLPHQER